MHELSLLGGPLHRLGSQLGLVRGGTNTVGIGLALGASLWIVLMALAASEGQRNAVFALSTIAGHARLLLAIPLLFICESALAPGFREFMRSLTRSGVVPDNQLPLLESTIARAARWTNSWLPEAVCLLLAFVMSIVAPKLDLFGATAAYDPDRAAAGFSLTGWWYWAVCLTVFRFLLFRWLWRLVLWWYVLWRISQLQLNLIPTHADGAGGLGYLEVVHTQFAPLVLAVSVLESASFAEEIAAGTMAFSEIYLPIAVLLCVHAALFIAPLFIFARKLWACREKGLSDYAVLASRYSIRFDDKWLGTVAPADPLLGTPDIQSLADLSNAFEVVRRMRLVPASLRMFIVLAAAALLPMVPLLLLKYPVAEIAERLLKAVSGL